jgi:hypothetical protein
VEPSLRRKTSAALATPRSEDCSAGTGAHAQPETVNFRTATVIGLKSALAHDDMLLVAGPVDTGYI